MVACPAGARHNVLHYLFGAVACAGVFAVAGFFEEFDLFHVFVVTLKREAARRALGIDREDDLTAIGAGQRPACAAIQA